MNQKRTTNTTSRTPKAAERGGAKGAKAGRPGVPRHQGSGWKRAEQAAKPAGEAGVEAPRADEAPRVDPAELPGRDAPGMGASKRRGS